MDKIIIIGGGGHARVLKELIVATERFEIIGVLDPLLKVGTEVMGLPVLGNDDLLPDLLVKGVKNACIAVGSIKDNNKRKTLYEHVKRIGVSVPPLIHSRSIISGEAQIHEGVQIMAGAVIQTGSIIGEDSIINTGAIVDHDCVVGKHVHICPGVVISGGCLIGEGAFIGTGATIIQGIKIGKDAVIGAGSVVVKDVPDGAVVKGVPAK
jgi:UDP-perosamine 4-acetyltransferase